MPAPTPVPDTSLLAAYAQQGAFTDCYQLTVPAAISLPQFIEAFYTTPLFKLERWILAKALKVPSTDEQAAQLAQAQTARFSAWKVEHRSPLEILLDAGQTRSWLCVEPLGSPQPATTLLFGSAVLPMRTGGRFGFAFHALLGFHRLYSKLLLSAAAKKALAIQRAQGAV